MANSPYLIGSETLTNIANAIRTKTGGSSPIQVDQMATEIGSITGGYTTTIDGVDPQQDLTLTSQNDYKTAVPNMSGSVNTDTTVCLQCRGSGKFYRLSSDLSSTCVCLEIADKYNKPYSWEAWPYNFRILSVAGNTITGIGWALYKKMVTMCSIAAVDTIVYASGLNLKTVGPALDSVTTIDLSSYITAPEITGLYPIIDEWGYASKIYVLASDSTNSRTQVGVYDFTNSTYTSLAAVIEAIGGEIPGVVYNDMEGEPSVLTHDLFLYKASTYTLYRYKWNTDTWTDYTINNGDHIPANCKAFYIPSNVDFTTNQWPSGVAAVPYAVLMSGSVNGYEAYRVPLRFTTLWALDEPANVLLNGMSASELIYVGSDNNSNNPVDATPNLLPYQDYFYSQDSNYGDSIYSSRNYSNFDSLSSVMFLSGVQSLTQVIR